MEIESKHCLLTGCSVLVHDDRAIGYVNGDLYLTINNFTGCHTLYMGGIGRGKDGRMHCVSYEKDWDELPAADFQVIGGIVMMPCSDTGYGQFTFAQGTCLFAGRIIDMLDRFFPESKEIVLSKYVKDIFRLS